MSGSSDSPRYPLKRCPIIDDGKFFNFLIWDSNAGKLACYTYTPKRSYKRKYIIATSSFPAHGF